MYNIVRNFIKNEDGLVTIEWVGIAAVVVLAGILISNFMLQEASDLGNATADKLDQANTALSSSATITPADFSRTAGGTGGTGGGSSSAMKSNIACVGGARVQLCSTR